MERRQKATSWIEACKYRKDVHLHGQRGADMHAFTHLFDPNSSSSPSPLRHLGIFYWALVYSLLDLRTCQWAYHTRIPMMFSSPRARFIPSFIRVVKNNLPTLKRQCFYWLCLGKPTSINRLTKIRSGWKKSGNKILGTLWSTLLQGKSFVTLLSS